MKSRRKSRIPQIRANDTFDQRSSLYLLPRPAAAIYLTRSIWRSIYRGTTSENLLSYSIERSRCTYRVCLHRELFLAAHWRCAKEIFQLETNGTNPFHLLRNDVSRIRNRQNVLIIEDDLTVEFIHRSYLGKMGLFQAPTPPQQSKMQREFVSRKTIALILIDIHLKRWQRLDIRENCGWTKRTMKSAIRCQRSAQRQGRTAPWRYRLFGQTTFERFKKYRLVPRKAAPRYRGDQATIDSLLQNKQHPPLPDDLEKGLSIDTLTILTVIHDIYRHLRSRKVKWINAACPMCQYEKYISHLEQNSN